MSEGHETVYDAVERLRARGAGPCVQDLGPGYLVWTCGGQVVVPNIPGVSSPEVERACILGLILAWRSARMTDPLIFRDPRSGKTSIASLSDFQHWHELLWRAHVLPRNFHVPCWPVPRQLDVSDLLRELEDCLRWLGVIEADDAVEDVALDDLGSPFATESNLLARGAVSRAPGRFPWGPEDIRRATQPHGVGEVFHRDLWGVVVVNLLGADGPSNIRIPLVPWATEPFPSARFSADHDVFRLHWTGPRPANCMVPPIAIEWDPDQLWTPGFLRRPLGYAEEYAAGVRLAMLGWWR